MTASFLGRDELISTINLRGRKGYHECIMSYHNRSVGRRHILSVSATLAQDDVGVAFVSTGRCNLRHAPPRWFGVCMVSLLPSASFSPHIQ